VPLDSFSHKYEARIRSLLVLCDLRTSKTRGAEEFASTATISFDFCLAKLPLMTSYG